MVKKVIKKIVTETIQEKVPKNNKIRQKDNNSSSLRKMTASEREELLIENFVGLQNAMTNLSIKFGSLSDNISKLLEVYEEAAKNYAISGKTDNEDMLRKINSLLDQNKTIAKGLVLMEAKLRSGSEGYAPPRIQNSMERPIIQQQTEDTSSKPKPKPLPSI